MQQVRSLLSRREFLRTSGAVTVALAGSRYAPELPQTRNEPHTDPMLDLDSLAQFVDPLPIPSVLQPAEHRPSPANPRIQIPFYRLVMQQIQHQLHRDLKPVKHWSFGQNFPNPTFETRSGEPLLVEWVNQLPNEHFLPIDHAIHGAEKDKPDVRTVVHLHGAKVPPESDGYPEDWYVPGKSATTFYPNNQDATMLWYHDHTMGINRLNVYAGLFGLFMVRDSFEDGFQLPSGKYEIPLIIYDRMIDSHGQLYYPVSPDPEAPWVPECFGDAMLVNGKLFPYLDIEPRKYRFRIVNAANARFFQLSLSNGMEFFQIGLDQGLLPAPLAVKSVVLAPGERVDLIIDFSRNSGEQIVLENGPFVLMQFRVRRTASKDESRLPSTLRPLKRIEESSAVVTRMLTLGEMDDMIQNPQMMLLNNAHWSMPVTERPKLNSVEIWNLINLTDDSHPIHLHLVRFQILDRQRFEPSAYKRGGVLQFLGPVMPPGPEEAGWKDTVRAHPKMVTRIIVRFEGFTGRYVWHCHILEHEDNEMMRPYEVLAE